MFSMVLSAGLFGVQAYMINVEADLSQGLPSFDIVGLPDTAVKESRDRVRASIKNCGFEYPVSRITVNLAPGSVRKEGPIYDLAIFIAILKASKQLDASAEDSMFLGELSLLGEIRPVKGVLSMVITAKENGVKRVFVPLENAAESSVIDGIDIFPVKNIVDLLSHLKGETILPKAADMRFSEPPLPPMPDFCEVKGQLFAKRALEIAAAGGHNILLIGPPGSGKSMLAKRLTSILPDMTFEESIETTKLHSVAGTLPRGVSLIRRRTFRSPHHSVSPSGLTGGGTLPKPGEISLAHNGVLFLDELPEFSKQAMEAMRQPLEDGNVTISRVAGTLTYPCDIMFAAAMNPCPCGFFGHPEKACTCTAKSSTGYIGRISGPLLDRLDLHVEVPSVKFSELTDKTPCETSEEIRKRVNKARKIQQERYKSLPFRSNSRLTASEISNFCALTDESKALLKAAFEKMGLSARGYDRILKVSRTIADLEGSELILPGHIAEAVQFRSLDRKYWQRRG